MPTTPLTPRTPKSSQLRKRPRPAVFMEDLMNDDDEVREVDESGNAIKKSKMDGPDGLPITPSRLSNWLNRKRIASQNTTPRTQVTQTERAKGTVESQMVKKTWKDDGFDQWLGYMKQKWKKIRDERKAFMKANKGSMVGYQQSHGMTNLDLMIAMSRDKMNKEQWHILQMAETSIPGVYDCFAYVCGVIKRFSINIPRIFYVNYLEKPDNPSGRLVDKILPKMQKSYFLYEYEADESKFKSEMK